MIKFALLLIFYLWLLWVRPGNVVNGKVELELLPFWVPVIQLKLSEMIFWFANVGLLFAAIMGAIDQFTLKTQNKKLRKQLKKREEEVISLRQIATMEQEQE